MTKILNETVRLSERRYQITGGIEGKNIAQYIMHNVPLVIISEQFSEEDIQQLGALQNVHFLRRPFEFD